VTGDTILVDPYPRTLSQIFTTETRARLEALGEVVWHDGPPAPSALVDEHLPRTIAIVGQTALPAARLDRAPDLRAVLNVEGNFLPNLDYRVLARRRIPVLGIGPVFAQPVAELALGLALAAAREIPHADAAIRAGAEQLFGGDNAAAFLLHGKTVGLVGCGSIGRALLPLLRPFGGTIRAYDPWLADATLRELGVAPSGLDELFAASRVVFVLAPPTTENAGMIGRAQLDALAPGSVVVLVSRAPVVDWAALLEAAASGRIRVAVDVFPVEPIPPEEPARSTPNTILSAHRAGNVPEIWPRVGEMVVDDLEAVLAGRPPTHLQLADPARVTSLRSAAICPAGTNPPSGFVRGDPPPTAGAHP
jgi:phosphoglycerate dehydrogenase-like enzyme